MVTGWGSFQYREVRKAVVVGTEGTTGKWGSDDWGPEASLLEALSVWPSRGGVGGGREGPFPFLKLPGGGVGTIVAQTWPPAPRALASWLAALVCQTPVFPQDPKLTTAEGPLALTALAQNRVGEPSRWENPPTLDSQHGQWRRS